MNARRVLLAAALALAALPAPAAAQFGLFGPNKIQYRPLDWQVLRGEHVDLHFYPEAEELARVALTYAEQSYDELAVRFRHAVPYRIPLIVYASHADFEQTNLLPFVPPEGILGFTEYGRSRVVLPFRGSYVDFRHTIRHEMAHVFQLSVTRLTADTHPRVGRIYWPLWWSEGMAEHFSGGQDTQDDMVLRDLTLGGRLPTIAQLEYAGGGIVYAIGGALMDFLAERYGEWRFVQAYDDSWKYASFGEVLAGVTGRSLEELTAEWHYAMKRRWFPLVESQRPVALDARRVARQAIKPAVWVPPGDSVAQVIYLSPRTGYTDLYSVPLGGGPERTLLRGERSAQFESFHGFESRLDVNPAGVVVFASRFLERDALFFFDVTRRAVVGRYQFPELVSILSPSWAPDGRAVVFSGLSLAGYSDLYLLHLADGRLERLTSDRHRDSDPSFSPDGTRIVFASDRTSFGPSGAVNLFLLDLPSRRLRPLTHGDWRDEGPRWSAAADRIVFTSDRRGTRDLYLVDSTGAGRRETGVPGGVYDPVWVASAGQYVFGAFEDLAFNLYALRRPPPDSLLADSGAGRDGVMADQPGARPAGDVIRLAADPPPSGWRWPELDDPRYAGIESARFSRRFSVDFAGADAAVAPGVGYAQQGATLVLSDQLADHVVGINLLAYQQGTGLSDVFANINGVVTYLNQSRRLNWGGGVFRLRGRFYENTFDRTYQETSAGAFGVLRYPLTRFTRVEGRMQLEHSDRVDFSLDPGGGLDFPRRKGVLASNYLSYVTDNALWLPTGPIDGGRMNVTAGFVSDLSNARFDSWLVSVDARRYLRTSLTTAFALRALVYYAGGERPQRVALGGSWGLRGYPRFTYVTGSRALMLNAEWRFPLTDYLSFGFPFGEARFPGIQGAVFGDLGRAWTPTSTRRGGIGAYGLGLRMNLGFPLVLRLDYGWRFGAVSSGYALPRSYRKDRFVDVWFGFNY